ncbi:hypothetical protein HOY80DRAFT_1035959 [Tuber brumale]|nr:hypothetical protein HOY80DRAFT_1035959 [Tuber brumale]
MNDRQKLFEDPPTSFPDGKSLEQRFVERNVARETGRSTDEVPLKKKGSKEKGPGWLLLLGQENEADGKRKKKENEETDGYFEGDWNRDGGRLHSRSELKSMEGSRGGWAQIHRRQSEGDSAPERWKPSGKWNTREQPDNWRSQEKRERRWSLGQGGWQPSSPISPTNPGGRRYSWANREDRSRFYQSKALQNDWRAREDEPENECLDIRGGYCDPESTHYIRNALSAMAHSYNHPRIPTFLSEILELVNGSLGEHALKFVVDTMFRVAPTTEDHVTGKLSLSVYVEFSRSLAKSISPNTADKNIKDSSGRALSGSDLVKVYISEKCKSLVKKDRGLIRPTMPRRMPLFFGELYRHDLCPEAMVVFCIKELLGHGKSPEADSVRTLCELLEITGKKLYKRKKTRIVVDEALGHIREFTSEEDTDDTVRLELLVGTQITLALQI